MANGPGFRIAVPFHLGLSRLVREGSYGMNPASRRGPGGIAILTIGLANMRTIAVLTFFAAALLLTISARGEENWKKIENQWFSFSVPPSFKKTEAQGTDSFVEAYAADHIELSFDYGIYSNNFLGWPKDTKFENVKIDGKTARIGTAMWERDKGFPYSTQVHIKLDGENALSMFAACKSEKEVALARKIFVTLAFKRK